MYSGMFVILVLLFIGCTVKVHNKSFLKYINIAVAKLIYTVIFLMGFSIASLENLLQNLGLIIKTTSTFFFFISIVTLSVLLLVDKKLPVNVIATKKSPPISSMISESLKLVLIVVFGFLAGTLFHLDITYVEMVSEYVLYILLFLIGIQLGNSGLSLRQILLNRHGILIALAVITASLTSGIISAKVLGISVFQGLAIASGFGWYSLSGILIGEAYGPVYGSASFLLELIRELTALTLIPLFIRSYPCMSIGYAGATAMDFTLPIIQATGGIRCVPVAIVSGFILSFMVPILIMSFVSVVG